jgi:hypothetical protein
MWVGAFGDAPLPYTPGRLNVPPSSTRLGREWFEAKNLIHISGGQIPTPDRLWDVICKKLKAKVAEKTSVSVSASHGSETEVGA